MLLGNKIAVIYGGGGSIGGPVARAFGREGARVFLAGSTLATLEAVAEAIRAAAGAAETAKVDALDRISLPASDGEIRAKSTRHERRRRVRNRSLHVHVPRRVHRRPQRGAGQRARRRWGSPARLGNHRPEPVFGQVFDEFMSTGATVARRGTFEPAGGWGGDHHDGVPILVLGRREPGIDMGGGRSSPT